MHPKQQQVCRYEIQKLQIVVTHRSEIFQDVINFINKAFTTIEPCIVVVNQNLFLCFTIGG